MTDLTGKKVLMFSPYGATKHYGVAIQKELERRGAIVTGYDERPSQKAITKIIIRLFKKKVPQIFDRYITRVIKENTDVAFDYVLVCRGEAFTPYTVTHIKQAYPNAKCILYLWDVMHDQAMADVVDSFDKAYSFDPGDVEAHQCLTFRPTFFVDEYLNVEDKEEKKKDVLFIGTLSGERYKVISKIGKAIESKGLSFVSYLYIPGLLMYLKDCITKFPYISIKKVHFDPISVVDTVALLNDTRAILDINYSYQRSLSTRAHEAMASRRKYITTNPEIKGYDYYNPNNVLIIDRDNPDIPVDFFKSEFEPVPEEILYKYSVRGLIDDLFGE